MTQTLTLTLILLLASIPSLTHCVKIIVTDNECVNCSRYRASCEVNTTGWTAFKMHMSDANLVRRLVNVYDSETSNNMANCVFDEYTLIAEIETFLCFWAPYFGCQAVTSKNYVNKHHFHRVVCHICAKYCKCRMSTKSAAYIARESSIYFCQIICFVFYYLINGPLVVK
ncbi:uncharacterized protein LOC111604347 [Drosophila hydei]|uniref:Uncharacterized protein LOC111604347 n=1 Tax=Drosophila hydei TaxID=7224 RepID=A0A6J1MGF2_DROHY|nr:uncharacterized protein LOC111604347 [Drosophila hydei]